MSQAQRSEEGSGGVGGGDRNLRGLPFDDQQATISAVIHFW